MAAVTRGFPNCCLAPRPFPPSHPPRIPLHPRLPRSRCFSSLPPFAPTPGRLLPWCRPAVPGVCWPQCIRPCSLLSAPRLWRCPSRSLHRARLSVSRASAVALSVQVTSRASAWGLMASWGPRSARRLPLRSLPSPRPCTTSPGSAGKDAPRILGMGWEALTRVLSSNDAFTPASETQGKSAET